MPTETMLLSFDAQIELLAMQYVKELLSPANTSPESYALEYQRIVQRMKSAFPPSKL